MACARCCAMRETGAEYEICNKVVWPDTLTDSPLARTAIGTPRTLEALASTVPEVTMPSSVAMLGGLPLLADTAEGWTATTAWDL